MSAALSESFQRRHFSQTGSICGDGDWGCNVSSPGVTDHEATLTHFAAERRWQRRFSVYGKPVKSWQRAFFVLCVCKFNFSLLDHLQFGEKKIRVEDHKRQLNKPNNSEYFHEFLAVELQTTFREDFTITGKAPSRAFSWSTAPTCTRHYANGR